MSIKPLTKMALKTAMQFVFLTLGVIPRRHSSTQLTRILRKVLTVEIYSQYTRKRGSEWGGPLVGCRLKFSYFVGSRLKISIFVGCRLISVNK